MPRSRHALRAVTDLDEVDLCEGILLIIVNGRLMRIYHITSLECLTSILREGVYVPKSLNPYDNDNGLNCFPFTKGFKLNQSFGGQGVILVLKWTGSIVNTHMSSPPPLKNGCLHQQPPWRCFIRGPIGPNDLKVVNVKFSRWALEEYLSPSWYLHLPTFLKRRLVRKSKLTFIVNLRRLYRTQQCYLQVKS